MDRRRKWMLGLLVVLLSLVTIELCSWLVIAVAPTLLGADIPSQRAIYERQRAQVRELLARTRGADPPRVQIDSVLGWRYRAGFRAADDVINAQGLRSARAYSERPLDRVLRVAVFGDSFVYGTEVATHQAWPSVVERLRPGIEMLNFGVGGYGVDQALLRFRIEGMRLAPSIVVMGFTPDDLSRLVNVYRPFLDVSEFPLAKPRFVLDAEGSLRLLPAPLRDTADYARLAARPAAAARFGEVDQWYSPAIYENPLHDVSATVRVVSMLGTRVYRRFLAPDRLLEGDRFRTGSTAFRLQVALMRAFGEEAGRAGARAVVAMLPDRASLEQVLAGREASYAALAVELREAGLDVVDLASAFAAAGTASDVHSWFARGGHYSPLGNEIVAGAMARELDARAALRRGDGDD